jgi:hypothetical protein
MSRYQIIIYCIISGAYTLHNIYYKYNKIPNTTLKNQRKKKKMLYLGGMLLSSSLLGFLLTSFMGRRLVKSIQYVPESNKLEVI